MITAGLLGGACANGEEVERAQRIAEVRLAEQREIADELQAKRAELDKIEAQLAEARAELDAADAGSYFRAFQPLPPIVLPEASVWESRHTRRQREAIDDAREREAALRKVNGPVADLPQKRKQLHDTLEVLLRLRKWGGPTPRD